VQCPTVLSHSSIHQLQPLTDGEPEVGINFEKLVDILTIERRERVRKS
jgi:hypothetical protein